MIGILQFKGAEYPQTRLNMLHTSALMIRGPKIDGILWAPLYSPLSNGGENFLRLSGYWQISGTPLAKRDPAIMPTARDGEKMVSAWMDFFPTDLENRLPPWAHELVRSIRAANLKEDQRAVYLLFCAALARIAPSAEILIQMLHALEGRTETVDSRLVGLAFVRMGGE